MNDVPILFLVFNRPDTTGRVFEFIRSVKPSRLFVAADGPRASKAGEAALCQQTRDVTENVDWACEVIRLYRDENLGCKAAVSSAITWFFRSVEAGIILEDDCLPDLSFVSFCSELLERYRDDHRIMHIGGNSFQQGKQRGPASYFFSNLNHIWGWATWRRAWKLYDVEMKSFPSFTDGHMKGVLDPSEEVVRYWMSNLEKTWRGEIDTWDYQWTFTLWINGGLSITPQVNLVQNIGFDERATHTKASDSPGAHLQAESLGSLIHPALVCRDADADLFTLRGHFRIQARPPLTVFQKIKRGLKKVLFLKSR